MGQTIYNLDKATCPADQGRQIPAQQLPRFVVVNKKIKLLVFIIISNFLIISIFLIIAIFLIFSSVNTITI